MIIAALLIVGLFYVLWNQRLSKLKIQLGYLETKIQQFEADLGELKNPLQTPLKEGHSTQIKTSEQQVSSPIHSDFSTASESIYPSLRLSTFTEEEPHPVQETLLKNVFQFLKDNFLTVIGILTLVLGIGYFVKYAIDQNWINETLRVLIGLFIGISVVGIGHYFRRAYSVFSSILVGGGISIMYFTVTIAFREYALFPQTYAFVLLAFITLLSIILSFIYHQQVLLIFSILGGFAAPLMLSTGESNYTFLFTYLFILHIGTLFIQWKKDWTYPGILSFLLTVLYFSTWVFEPNSRLISMFLALHYTVFTTIALLPHFKQHTLQSNSVALYIGNTLLFTLFGLVSYQYYYTDFITFTPLLLACISFGIAYYFRTSQHVLSQSSLALGLSLVTLAIGVEF